MINENEIQKFIFRTTNVLKVQEYLEENPDIDPRRYKDTKGNTILHHLSNSDEIDLTKLYINHTARLLDRRLSQSK